MGGLGALFVIGIYIFVAYKVVGLAKTKALKVVTLAVVLLIPTADAIYGRIKLKQMCAAEGGLKINRVVEHVEGFVVSATDGYDVTHYGYQFTEAENSPGKYYRASQQNGQIVIEENVTPKSKFRVKLSTLEDIDNLYWRQYGSIESFPSGAMLATDTQIGYRGGWAERLIATFSDAGIGAVALCSSAGLDTRKLTLMVLKP